jgi:hypothetical protein
LIKDVKRFALYTMQCRALRIAKKEV